MLLKAKSLKAESTHDMNINANLRFEAVVPCWKTDQNHIGVHQPYVSRDANENASNPFALGIRKTEKNEQKLDSKLAMNEYGPLLEDRPEPHRGSSTLCLARVENSIVPLL
jgi:hypothetical protein